jgi:hypothetical protein
VKQLGPALARQALTIDRTRRARNWATAHEIEEAVRRDCEEYDSFGQPGSRRYQRNLFEHVEATYGAVRKWIAIGGDGAISTHQLARELYPDAHDYASCQRKRESIRRHLALLVRQKLLTKEELCAGSGKKLGLRVVLLPIPEEISTLARVRGCRSSSAGRAPVL